MTIREVIAALERFAPLPLQESYDNAGLQCGLTEVEVSGALLCLDVTPEVVLEAVEKGYNLIIAHHPLLFRGIKCVADRNLVERTLRLAIKNDVAIYASHTNLDNVRGGVNYEIAQRLGLNSPQILRPLVGHADAGSGVLAEWETPLSAYVALQHIKAVFKADCVMHNALLERPIKRVALCGGSGSFLCQDAVAAGADLFLTGEMGYHDFFGWEGQIQLAVIGHYESEQYTLHLLERVLAKALPQLRIRHTAVNRPNPVHYL
ncbi:MAG: Nif3-like dinuclear metal center hexameric protein [Bacteroidales bacterium]|nr:Nif3-like dinuclear metal center hexameric protein [Bacteroidales bacterium]